MTDFELLRSYATSGSEAAFATLVERYRNLVYSAALRQAGNPNEAAEISQVVFITLARKVRSIGEQTIFAGWLLRTTRFVALNALRRQSRRMHAEREAANTNLLIGGTDSVWNQVAPLLDEAIASLGQRDRDAVALRFFQDKSFKEIGKILHTSEDNAQKRVSRALNKLRKICAGRGTIVTSSILATVITAKGVQAAPSQLASAVLGAVTSGSAVKASVATSTKLTLSALRRERAQALAGKAGVAVLALLAVWFLLREPFRSAKRASTGINNSGTLAPQQTASVMNGGVAPPVVSNVRQLRLLVIDSRTEQPIRNATVASIRGGAGSLTNFTDVRGECLVSFGTIQEEYWNFLIHVIKDGYVPRFASWAERRGDSIDEIPRDYTVRLDPGLVIGGSVVSTQGEPISGAEVFLYGAGPLTAGDGPGEREGVAVPHIEFTDSDGRWLCNHVPPEFEKLRISFTHQNYAEASYDVAKFATKGNPAYLLEHELRSSSAVVTLKPGLLVSGAVMSSEGEPIAGATVFRNRSWDFRLAQTTGSDGRFGFGNVSESELILTAQAEGFVADDKVVRPSGAAGDVMFKLSHAAVLRGRIVDERGNAVVKATISATGGDFGSGRFQWEAAVDQNGRFEWLSAPPYQKSYNVQAPGYIFVGNLKLTPDGAEHTIILQQSTPAPRFRIAGTVSDAQTGQPVDRFEVWVAAELSVSPEVRRGPSLKIAPELHATGQEGRFALLPRQSRALSFGIEIRADGYFPAGELIPGPLTNDCFANFKLKAVELLTGFARLPDDQPATGAVVLSCCSKSDCAFMTLPGQFDLKSSRGNRTQTDLNGGFAIPRAGTTGTVFVAHQLGFCEASVESLLASNVIKLQPWGQVTGLLTMGGKPLPHETIYLGNLILGRPSVGLHRRVSTDADGKFTFECVPPGDLEISNILRARDDGGHQPPSTQSLPIQVHPGQITEVRLGGSGRKVLGRIQATELGHLVDWQTCTVTLTTELPGLAVPPPEQFGSEIEYARAVWAWRDRKFEFQESATSQEYLRNVREYSAILQNDGTFEINDIAPGTYEMSLSSYPLGRVVLGQADVRRRSRFDNCIREIVVPEAESTDQTPVDLGVWEISLSDQVR